MSIYEDEGTFKSVRKNFLSINFLILILFYANPSFGSFSQLGISFHIDPSFFYFWLWTFYSYYSIRLLQEIGPRLREFSSYYRNFYLKKNRTFIDESIKISTSKNLHKIVGPTDQEYTIEVLDEAILYNTNGIESRNKEWLVRYRIDPTKMILAGNLDKEVKTDIQNKVTKHYEGPMLKIVWFKYSIFRGFDSKLVLWIKIKYFVKYCFQDPRLLFHVLPIPLGLGIFVYAFFESNWFQNFYIWFSS